MCNEIFGERNFISTAVWQKAHVAGREVFFVDTDALAACFEPDIDEALVRAIAERQPLRAVFRDAGFSDDSLKINVEQLFQALSPGTEVRAI